MKPSDIAALCITGALGLIITALALLLLSGRGAFLIAGFNTLPKSEQAKFDSQALSRFMGRLLLPIGLLMPAVALGGILSLSWIGLVYTVLVVGLVVFAVIYANTGKRFRL